MKTNIEQTIASQIIKDMSIEDFVQLKLEQIQRQKSELEQEELRLSQFGKPNINDSEKPLLKKATASNGKTDAILNLLRESSEPLSNSDVAERIGSAVKSVRDLMTKLVKRGKVKAIKIDGKLEKCFSIVDLNETKDPNESGSL